METFTTTMPQKPQKLEHLEEGKQVLLVFRNEEQYQGIFKGMDGDNTIMLRSISGKHVIGLPLAKLDFWMEIITE